MRKAYEFTTSEVAEALLEYLYNKNVINEKEFEAIKTGHIVTNMDAYNEVLSYTMVIDN